MGLAASLCACLSERPRPGPPTIAFSLNKDTVQSRDPPDTLIVNVRAADPDGLDSVWVQLANGPPVGADGRFEELLESPFRVTVPPGLPQGSVLPVTVRARDVLGFASERDSVVQVAP
ncbi:MAG: hypothetical protein ACREMM_06445 [Gemmatimonadales bacterium]